MAVKISDRVGTFGETDIYATHDGNRGALGFHAVSSLLERNNIPYDRRRGSYQIDGEAPKPFFVSVRTGTEVKLWWLKNEPATPTTTDSDWEEFIAGAEDPFQGFFTPASSTLVNGTGTKGHYWIADSAGTFNSETYAQYDKTIYDGAVWKKVGGGTAVADWNTMTNKPTVFSPEAHEHPISEVVGLQTSLDNKVDWSNTEDTVSGLPEMIPNSAAITKYTYSQSEVDYKIGNLATYGIKYSWASSTAQSSETGMIVGDLGLRNDEQKVYKWNGTAWNYFFTVNTSGAALTQAVTSKVNVGNIVIGQTLALGTLFTDFVKKLLLKVTNPTYTQPTASISTSQALAVEIGSIISPTINASKSDGDSGGLINYTLKRGTTTLVNAASISDYTDSSVSITATTSYEGTFKFTQGAVKYDDDTPPQPYPIGRIEDTTLTSTINITPQRNLFFGVNVDAATSSNIRAFSDTILNPVDGLVFSINIPTGANNVAFAYPASLGLVGRVLDTGSNLDIKSSFVLTSVNVEGANGHTAIAYNVYKFTPVSSYSQDVTYTITI